MSTILRFSLFFGDTQFYNPITGGYLTWDAVTDDQGDPVEMLIVDIPLDSCGTTAEYDQENDKIVFSNTVRNGAFSVKYDEE